MKFIERVSVLNSNRAEMLDVYHQSDFASFPMHWKRSARCESFADHLDRIRSLIDAAPIRKRKFA